MVQLRIRHILILAAVALSACRQAPAPTPPLARLSLVRVATLTTDVEDDIEDLEPLAVDDSTIALLDYPASQVVLTSRSGQVLRVLGRHGGGPGEFQNPRFLVALPDGFAVYDDLKLALVTFDRTGTIGPEISLSEVTGSLNGILTGLARLPGGWAYSVREPPPLGPREALYARLRGASHLVAATPTATGVPVRLPCGITLSPQVPVFWPGLRWSAAGRHLAYSVTAADRVLLWDTQGQDTVVLEGGSTPRRSTAEAAAALPLGIRASTPGGGCSIDAAEVVRQRGLAPQIPVIRRLLVTPTGTLLQELDGKPPGHHLRLWHPDGQVDTLTTDMVPLAVLTDSLLVGYQTDGAHPPAVAVWRAQAAN